MGIVSYIKPDYGLITPDNGSYTLKPCPFCGGTPNLEQDCDLSWSVHCVNKRCFILPITLPVKNRHYAVFAWNHRAST